MLTIISCTEINLQVVAGICFAKICYSLVILEASVVTTFFCLTFLRKTRKYIKTTDMLGRLGLCFQGVWPRVQNHVSPQNYTRFACLGNAYIAAGFITAQTEGAEQ